MPDPDTYRRYLAELADEAERLQTQVNEFIGRATVARLDLPAALYDANAQLLLVPTQLRELAARSFADHRSVHASPAGGRS
ncbi:MAG TPA: hypothetical protein VFA46_17565 [Actinomycetes bacterium]|nr:hypothetical protein [Actinomycetes bacterium]